VGFGRAGAWDFAPESAHFGAMLGMK